MVPLIGCDDHTLHNTYPFALPTMVSHHLTVGALEIGVLLSTFLFGVGTVQVHVYFGRFPHDPVIIQALVATVWLLELGHSVCISHGLFTMTVTEYASLDLGSNIEIAPSFSIAVLFSGCLAALVQAYFTHRLRILSDNLSVAILFWVFSGLRLMGWVWAGTVGIIVSLKLSSEVPFVADWEWPLVPLLGFGACVDFAIAASLCYHFQKSRVNSTAELLDKLVLWTIQNGLITSIAGIATAICLCAMKQNFIWIAVFMVLTRLFSNSFLASVNARVALRRLSALPIVAPYEQSTMRFSSIQSPKDISIYSPKFPRRDSQVSWSQFEP